MRAFFDWRLAIKERLLGKENLRNKTQPRHNRIHPKSPLPFLRRCNERRNEGTEIWTQNHETRPNVDLSSPFVNEEEIFDEHYASALGDSGKEAVHDSEGHEGVKGSRARAAGGGPDGGEGKPE